MLATALLGLLQQGYHEKHLLEVRHCRQGCMAPVCPKVSSNLLQQRLLKQPLCCRGQWSLYSGA